MWLGLFLWALHVFDLFVDLSWFVITFPDLVKFSVIAEWTRLNFEFLKCFKLVLNTKQHTAKMYNNRAVFLVA